MDIKKGNPDKLAGEVIVYSSWKQDLGSTREYDLNEFTRLDSGEVVFALYATNDLERFRENTGILEDKIQKNDFEYLHAATEAILTNPECTSTHVHVSRCEFESLDDVVYEDVVYAGENSDPLECKQLAKKVIDAYFCTLIKQHKKPEHLRNFNGTIGELQLFLGSEFYYPMINAYGPFLRGTKDKSEYENEKERFISFVGDCELKPDAELLCELIESVLQPIDLTDRLAIPIIAQMSYLFSEDYESAAKMTTQVEGLKKDIFVHSKL